MSEKDQPASATRPRDAGRRVHGQAKGQVAAALGPPLVFRFPMLEHVTLQGNRRVMICLRPSLCRMMAVFSMVLVLGRRNGRIARYRPGTRRSTARKGEAEGRAQGEREERRAQEEGAGLAAEAGPDDRVHDRRRDVGLARRLARRQDDRLRAAGRPVYRCRSPGARPRRSPREWRSTASRAIRPTAR